MLFSGGFGFLCAVPLVPPAHGGSGKGGGGSFPREVLREGTGSSSLQTECFLSVLNLPTKAAACFGGAGLLLTVELLIP